VNADAEFNVFKALDFIRDHAPLYAKAKSERVFLEEFRKSKKALLMRQAEIDGHKTSAGQEREAYADPEYVELLQGLKAAVEEEERLRWLIVGAQAKIECWRTIEANRRAEAKHL
jgi:hypothetical protein